MTIQSSESVDWGTVPQWATAGVSLIVGLFSIYGITIAARSYRLSVADSHRRQARLVHVSNESNLVDGDNEFTAKLPFTANTSDIVWVGDDIFTVPDDALVSEIAVHNNSDEIISNIDVELVLKNSPTPTRPHTWTLDFVGPKAVRHATFIVRREAGDDAYAGISMRVEFDDSAGNRWRRFDMQPVQEVSRSTAK